jgi:hypothetical protein
VTANSLALAQVLRTASSWEAAAEAIAEALERGQREAAGPTAGPRLIDFAQRQWAGVQEHTCMLGTV